MSHTMTGYWKSLILACCIGDSCSNPSAKLRQNSDFQAIMSLYSNMRNTLTIKSLRSK